jgi:secreted Zn-dependent insulinase-like peptidase
MKTSYIWLKDNPRFKASLLLITLFAGFLGACAAPQHSGTVIEKSENDQRHYSYHVLPNKLRVLLISDPQTDKAAASLDVNVGSGDDPPNREGLAHFLEHMLFLGTGKYPRPGEYQDYISAHGGNHNAYTSFDHTNYFFDVDPDYLEPTLDRFAQFFIAPLFNEQYVQREMNAVNSEYTSKLKDDGRREWDVFKQLVNPKHPLAKFSVGNLETLQDGDTSVREDLLDFYRAHYSANQMTLVVLGRESLDGLKAKVLTRFGAIKNHEVARPGIEEPLLLPETLPAMVKIEPVQERRELTLLFPLPESKPYYRQKPLHYLGDLLGHEGEGSLLSALKKRGWAEGLHAGPGMVYDGGSSFQIGITLTEEGTQHIDEIIGLAFSMLDLVRESGLQEWRYREQQRLAQIAFRFQEPGRAIHTVMGLASGLHDTAPADVLRAPYLMREYDEALIRKFLDALVPENVLISLVSPEQMEDPETTYYYKTNYKRHALKVADLQAWQRRVSGDDLALPAKNPFIPESLSLKDAAGEATETPVLVEDSEWLRVWYRHDVDYRVPRAGIYLNFLTPMATDSPVHAALANLYVEMIRDQLNEHVYPAALAGINFSLRKHSRGLSLRIHGYDDKQASLLEKILATMIAPGFEEERFEIRKDELLRAWKNESKHTPYRQLMRAVNETLYTPAWQKPELIEAVTPLQLADLTAFIQPLLQDMRLEMLVHGNVTRSEVSDLIALVRAQSEQLEASGGANVIPPVYVVRLSGEDSLVLSKQIDHPDSALVFYVQGDDVVYQARADFALASQVLRSAFYTDLRTEQQLGYVVSAFQLPVYKVPGLAFVVQSPDTGVADLSNAVNEFLLKTVSTLEAMPEGQFEQHKRALVLRILERPKSLAELTEDYWQDIVLRRDGFDDKARLAEAVEGIDMQQWLDFYRKTFLNRNRRDLLFQAAGKNPMQEWQPAGFTRPLVKITDPCAFKKKRRHYTFE